jgi:hypothetical protein
MNKVIIFALTIIVQLNVNAQAKKFAKSITESDLKKHLNYIAGPECEGRGTGTPGIAKAAAYIETQFKNFGLTPGNNNDYQMYYNLVQDSITEGTITIDNKVFTINEDFSAFFRSNTPQQLNSSSAIYLGFGIKDDKWNDYKNVNAKGKIVIIEEGEPINSDSIYLLSGTKNKSEWSGSNNNKKAIAAKEAGALALFIIPKKYNKAPTWPARRNGLTPEFKLEKNALNRYNINESIVKAVFENGLPDPGGEVAKNISIVFNKVTFTTKASNVIGVIEGSDKKDEYLVITAHMDHLGKRGNVIYYGADDDGSGTCAVMEMAEAFAQAKKKGKGPRRTVIFMTVSGEEMGLYGSSYYANFPLYDLNKTTCNLNIDMIGRIGSDYLKGEIDSLNYVYIIGDDKLSSDLRPISEAANKSTNMKLDYRYNDPNDKNRFYYRSDHYNFAEKGVPIIFYFDGVHADYHRPTDTPDKINYDLYAKRTKLVFYTAWEMANRNDMLKRDIPLQ